MDTNTLKSIDVARKTGEERFELEHKKLEITLLEFWQWSQSDLLSNALRGVLAEFIVAKALGIETHSRTEWDSYDLMSKKGLKIEVKSSAYLQSWAQMKHSEIRFDISPRKGLDKESGQYSGASKRNSDIYVFCLLHHKDKKTVNVLDLTQWTFFVLQTSVLNDKRLEGKTIGLNSLLTLNPQQCNFEEIATIIEP